MLPVFLDEGAYLAPQSCAAVVEEFGAAWPAMRRHYPYGFQRGELIVLGDNIAQHRHFKSAVPLSMVPHILEMPLRYAMAAHVHYRATGDILRQEEYHAHAMLKTHPHRDLWAWAGFFFTHGEASR